MRYDRIKESENEISGHIDKVSRFQNERLAEELKTNAYYKRELDALRSNLHSTGSKVKSNHFPEDDEDYLINREMKNFWSSHLTKLPPARNSTNGNRPVGLYKPGPRFANCFPMIR